VKPRDQGGLCGIKFRLNILSSLGATLNIQWKAEAYFLAELHLILVGIEAKSSWTYVRISANGDRQDQRTSSHSATLAQAVRDTIRRPGSLADGGGEDYTERGPKRASIIRLA